MDKLAWTIAGRPLLAHTLDAVARVPSIDTIVLVVPADAVDDVGGAPWLPPRVDVVPGGERRQDSVASGFAALERLLPDPGGRRPVLVHDGARPVLSVDLAEAVVEATQRHGAAIPTIPVADTVKRLDDDRIVETVARDALALA
ncbi:MAG TPA: 2-C-methyl-D-erythritol 4-phosphate cytidylyltransferase, partial [Candidatus Limnocylindrales bacterium]